MAELIRNLYNLQSKHKGAVVTIGNFDGVHLGHQVLIDTVKSRAKALHVPSMVIIFEPQPLEFFAPEKKVARLTRFREKFLKLAQTHVDYVLVLRFNQTFAALSAEAFVKQILVDSLAVEHIIVGDDFRFGYQRKGDIHFLTQLGADYGFTVEQMPTIEQNAQRISSTRIRECLEDDQHSLAEQLLGQPYTMMGRVVHGDKLGRILGFPTANIFLHRAVTPVKGIYVVRMHGIDAEPLPGVANVGIRPTVGGTRSLLEVYLFNFNRDIYGHHVSVEFCKKLRDEEHYANLELLKDAIANDAMQAMTYFKERDEL